MKAPDVTVVVPTHNRRHLLAKTLASALRQRGVSLEVVVVDDASSDGTSELLRAQGDSRIRVVTTVRSGGVAEARNLGVAEARGRCIAFLDDDDLWSPDKLRAQLEALRNSDAGWAYTGAVWIDAGLAIVAGAPPPSPERVRDELPFRNVVPAGASNVLALRTLLAEAGPFDVRMRHMADWDLWIRLSRLGLAAAVPRPLVAYRVHVGNASVETHSVLDELDLVERKHAALRGGAPVDRVHVHRWIAWSRLRCGDRRGAVASYLRAARAGDGMSVARAAVALLHPRIVGRRMHRHLQLDSWLQEARTWLALQPVFEEADHQGTPRAR